MILCENSELILEACAMVVVVVPRICRPTQGYVDDVRSVDWQHKEPTYISLAHRWVVGQCSRVKPGSRKTGQYPPTPITKKLQNRCISNMLVGDGMGGRIPGTGWLQSKT